MENRIKKLSFVLVTLLGFSSYALSNTVEDYKKACLKQDAQGCLSLGLAYAKGIETEKNYELAKDYLGIACDLGNVQACTELKDVGQHRNDFNVGASDTEENNEIVVFRKACGRGDSVACWQAGYFYQYKSGKKVKWNYIKAAEYHKKGCDLGLSDSCFTLGVLYGGVYGFEFEHNDIKAAEYYKKACTLGESTGCFLLGLYYTYPKEDATKAKKYYKKACDLGGKLGCEKYKKMRDN